MGTAMAKRLVETGHAVIVWNRTAERTAAAAEAGATIAATLPELVSRCGIIITSLTDADALRAVYAGEGGLLSGDVAGKLFVDTSTVLPADEVALAGTVAVTGAAFIECPVGGTVGPALKGQLIGMAGGAAADVERARPILDALCRRVDHLGDVGTGSAMKLAVNLPLALYWATLGESVALLGGTGLSGATVAGILADSSAGPNVLRNRLDVVAAAIDGTDQEGTFDINGLRKDLTLALRWAETLGRPMPLSEAARGVYDAAIAAGAGRLDGASLARIAAGR
jgi:3-hydroxyisobutyrate dehydrogenase